jgi:hypothetical protein
MKRINKYLKSKYAGWINDNREYSLKIDSEGVTLILTPPSTLIFEILTLFPQRLGIFTNKAIKYGEPILRLTPLQFIHEEFPFTYGFSDIDRTYQVAAIPPITFFRPHNQLIHRLLFQFAWILDSA